MLKNFIINTLSIMGFVLLLAGVAFATSYTAQFAVWFVKAYNIPPWVQIMTAVVFVSSILGLFCTLLLGKDD